MTQIGKKQVNKPGIGSSSLLKVEKQGSRWNSKGFKDFERVSSGVNQPESPEIKGNDLGWRDQPSNDLKSEGLVGFG
jgi:hypothetical protein